MRFSRHLLPSFRRAFSLLLQRWLCQLRFRLNQKCLAVFFMTILPSSSTIWTLLFSSILNFRRILIGMVTCPFLVTTTSVVILSQKLYLNKKYYLRLMYNLNIAIVSAVCWLLWFGVFGYIHLETSGKTKEKSKTD